MMLRLGEALPGVPECVADRRWQQRAPHKNDPENTETTPRVLKLEWIHFRMWRLI